MDEYYFRYVIRQSDIVFDTDQNPSNGVPVGTNFTVKDLGESIFVIDDDPILEDNNNRDSTVEAFKQTVDTSQQYLKSDALDSSAGDYVWSRGWMEIQDSEGNTGYLYQIRTGVYDYSGGLVESHLTADGYNQYWAFASNRSDEQFKIETGEVYTTTTLFVGNANQEFELFTCFVRGSMIETDRGSVAIENLSAGDMIRTKDHGFQAINWIGSSAISAEKLVANPSLYPVRIKAGALGEGYPENDLYVSRQHRMLVKSRIALRKFGADEILVAAKDLLSLDGVDLVTEIDEVEYFHMLFDEHEIVYANGAESESLLIAPDSKEMLSKEAQDEIYAIFPQFEDPDFFQQPAREIVGGAPVRHLVQRSQASNGNVFEV